ncbi:MAG: NTP transferase domain-containing protein [Oscillospiraceae bacterium]|nr:NTP transferase domain-containing protein [Oscillospiraceae bacterium]
MDSGIKNLKVIILAAGKGKRFNSEEAQIPKQMRMAAGKPLLEYVLKSVDFIPKKDITIIVGFMKEMITSAFSEYTFVTQETMYGYGTGAAVRYAKESIGNYEGDILVLMSDMPLISQKTLLSLYSYHKENENDCTNLSCEINEVLELGRIVRDENENYLGIVENKDATQQQRENIKEYNTGNAIFDSKKLFEQLELLKPNEKNGEYYLTDVPKLFIENDYRVGVYKTQNSEEIHGANSMEELLTIEKIIEANSTK